ncbi:hypothetical protein Cch01nite_20740 [Cellulomonas chitinilytica]|uniref:DoxX family protein n=1 Tax=Cellulomonas chitinilytica TaxID=398759 RepID=A0A919TZ57_9CELL|nr:DoxX family protein [Cellulomonas chitinilytica]GIG21350.1 hypothetical protein Cch01nite_20740 [Cellulomonas chitinilytica]
MDIVFWVVAGLLALAFLAAGLMKVARSKEQLAASGMAWTEDFSDRSITLIGAVEVAGALGLVLPALTGIAPVLTPVAAVGLAVAMVGAIVVHARRQEPWVPQAVLLVLTLAATVLGVAYVG